jgi:hypothetical protein
VAADGADFRQLGQKRARGDVSDTGNELEQRFGLATDRRDLNGLADVPIKLRELPLHEGDVAAEPPDQFMRTAAAALAIYMHSQMHI